MKKLFTLFVALTAVVSLSAKTIYLVANDDWKSYGAVFFVHSWGGVADADAKLALVTGEESVFSADIPDDNNNLLFVRAQGESTSIPWDTENLWTKTGDLEIPEGKDCFTLTDWTNGVWSKYGDPVLPSVSIVGNFEGDVTWGKDAHPMTPAIDSLTASVTFALPKDTFEIKVWVDGDYLSLNGEGETLYRIHRDWNHADNVNLVNSGRNFEFIADVAGDYTFTWTYASKNLVVTYPEIPTGIENRMVQDKAVKRIVNGQLVIEKNGVLYNALGAEMR